MLNISSKSDKRNPKQTIWSLFGLRKEKPEVPEKLVHRLKRMERDLSRRLPARGFLKP